ncbi:MAG TPA: hypothetical protein VGO64_04560, partial [Candidatus Limnocylindrales bacterium]|nr:hypothetical protein [Candidatus Limnocylindrales bacterium]
LEKQAGGNAGLLRRSADLAHERNRVLAGQTPVILPSTTGSMGRRHRTRVRRALPRNRTN